MPTAERRDFPKEYSKLRQRVKNLEDGVTGPVLYDPWAKSPQFRDTIVEHVRMGSAKTPPSGGPANTPAMDRRTGPLAMHLWYAEQSAPHDVVTELYRLRVAANLLPDLWTELPVLAIQSVVTPGKYLWLLHNDPYSKLLTFNIPEWDGADAPSSGAISLARTAAGTGVDGYSNPMPEDGWVVQWGGDGFGFVLPSGACGCDPLTTSSSCFAPPEAYLHLHGDGDRVPASPTSLGDRYLGLCGATLNSGTGLYCGGECAPVASTGCMDVVIGGTHVSLPYACPFYGEEVYYPRNSLTVESMADWDQYNPVAVDRTTEGSSWGFTGPSYDDVYPVVWGASGLGTTRYRNLLAWYTDQIQSAEAAEKAGALEGWQSLEVLAPWKGFVRARRQFDRVHLQGTVECNEAWPSESVVSKLPLDLMPKWLDNHGDHVVLAHQNGQPFVLRLIGNANATGYGEVQVSYEAGPPDTSPAAPKTLTFDSVSWPAQDAATALAP